MGEPVKKITVNVPKRVLEKATRITGLGITSTIVAGLKEIERGDKRSALRSLRGKVGFELDLKKTRR